MTTKHLLLNADLNQYCAVHSPPMRQHQPFSREGCLILVKTGHLT
jgi:hypothetical protein